MSTRIAFGGLAVLVAVAAGLNVVSHDQPGARRAIAQQGSGETPPVFAYYYIWFDETSWDRAKRDYPLLGRYSSDSVEVMREQIRAAKAAGIDAFLVSWKATSVLTDRLETLMWVAAQEDFKLGIVYQALDFDRNPISVDQISADLDFFSDELADDPVFDIYDAPLVIIAGTWEFTPDEVERLAGQHRLGRERGIDPGQAGQLLILASERDPADYSRLAGLVDGNAYYWSSVDPTTYRDYEGRLQAMRDAVGDGLWIAPAAPGFDARLLGGTREVPRRDGETLRMELTTAIGSQPDAIGLISWNEFSENTHVEPSVQYGTSALETLIEFTGGTAPSPSVPTASAAAVAPSEEFDRADSSSPAGSGFDLAGALAVVVVGALVAGGLATSVQRARRAPTT